MPTLSEVDEALRHASLVPEDARGAGWHAFVDGLLETRAMLALTYETRGHAHAH
jgi:hypothetical protein